MANAARTMGLSGMQNLNTEQKPKNGTAPANNNRSEVENSPANNQNSKNSNQVGNVTKLVLLIKFNYLFCNFVSIINFLK